MTRRAPNLDRRHALVVGAGVSGLTTAHTLLERGHAVTILARETGRATTSWVAGALWELPPAVCGDDRPLDDPSVVRDTRWAIESLARFGALHRAGASGVDDRPVTFYFDTPLTPGDREHAKMLEIERHTRSFVRGAPLLERLPAAAGVCDAYRHDAPQIDMDAYLPWLLGRVRSMGGELINGTADRLSPALLERFGADVLVNATGLESATLADDTVTPVLGVLVQVRNDGTDFPPIRDAHCTSATGAGPDTRFVFVLPNGDDRLVLGGIAWPHSDAGAITPDHPIVGEIRGRCARFLPQLERSVLLEDDPVRIGHRPVRPGGARVERDLGTGIIHNYGHGGAGVLLSWGAASDAADLAEQATPAATVATAARVSRRC